MTPMVEIAVAGLIFITITSIGGGLLVAHAARRRPVQDRLVSVTGTGTAPRADIWQHRVERAANKVPMGRPSARLKQTMAEAGFHGANAALNYLFSKVVLLLLAAVLLIALLPLLEIPFILKMALVLVIPMTMFFVPNVIVQIRRQKRCSEVRRHLPDALDLLEICVSSGMGLDMAWNSVASEIRGVSATLGDEMALTNLEMHLGAGRSDAMRHMANRTDTEELRSLVVVLLQSDRFGTSVSEALRVFAKSMRESRSQRAEEAAERMAVKLLFPMVIFIFPVVIMIAAGPAGIVLARTFGRG